MPTFGLDDSRSSEGTLPTRHIRSIPAALCAVIVCNVLVTVLPAAAEDLFGPRTDYGAGSGPIGGVVGDLNADGHLDVVVANYYSNTVSVFLGNGDGTLGTRSDFATGTQPYSVAIGMLNSDAVPDLAVTNNASHTVSIFLGNGDGTFRPKVDYASGVSPQSVAVGDFDGVGNLDLAVVNVHTRPAPSRVSDVICAMLASEGGTPAWIHGFVSFAGKLEN